MSNTAVEPEVIDWAALPSLPLIGRLIQWNSYGKQFRGRLTSVELRLDYCRLAMENIEIGWHGQFRPFSQPPRPLFIPRTSKRPKLFDDGTILLHPNPTTTIVIKPQSA